jgi:hypothetical protein
MSTFCDFGDFSTAGAFRFPAVLSVDERDSLMAIADALPAGRLGMRLSGDPVLARILEPTGCVGRMASRALGQAVRPVRALLFNKTAEANWVVA